MCKLVERFHETKQLICIFDRVENGQAVYHGYQAILKANSQQVLQPVFNRNAYGISMNVAVPEYRLSEEQLKEVTSWEDYRCSAGYVHKPDMAVMLDEQKKKGLSELALARCAVEQHKPAADVSTMNDGPLQQVA